jgi:hypothetical protein
MRTVIPNWADAAMRVDMLALRAMEERPDWLPQRLHARLVIDAATGCHVWSGGLTRGGYAQIAIPLSVAGKIVKARIHRLAWMERVGTPIPYGLTVDHVCRNRLCANPDHLEAVTVKDNVLRAPNTSAAIRKARTHCPAGHPLTGPDADLRRLGPGEDPEWRRCRRCQAEHSRAARARRIAARAEVA